MSQITLPEPSPENIIPGTATATPIPIPMRHRPRPLSLTSSTFLHFQMTPPPEYPRQEDIYKFYLATDDASYMQIGGHFVNQKACADCILRVVDRNTNSQHPFVPKRFFGHRAILEIKSYRLRRAFQIMDGDYNNFNGDSDIMDFDEEEEDEDEKYDPVYKYVFDQDGHWPEFLLEFEQPESFDIEEFLHWLYTGNKERFLSNCTNVHNYQIVATNLEILGLEDDAEWIIQHYDS